MSALIDVCPVLINQILHAQTHCWRPLPPPDVHSGSVKTMIQRRPRTILLANQNIRQTTSSLQLLPEVRHPFKLFYYITIFPRLIGKRQIRYVISRALTGPKCLITKMSVKSLVLQSRGLGFVSYLVILLISLIFILHLIFKRSLCALHTIHQYLLCETPLSIFLVCVIIVLQYALLTKVNDDNVVFDDYGAV